MGAINQMNRFTPISANLCAALRPLLAKNDKLKLEKEHEKTFAKIQQDNEWETTYFASRFLTKFEKSTH